MFATNPTTLSIPNAGTDSPELDLGASGSKRVITIAILAPAAVTGTITVLLCDVSGGTFRTLQTGGADITIAATKAVVITAIPATGVLKIHSSAAEAAQRDFRLIGANLY